jgi:DNA-binding NarL/FixJ family response regulator
VSVLLGGTVSPAASPAGMPTAMVVARDARVRTAATRRLRALGVRDVVEVATVAEARTRMGTPRDLCVVDVALVDGSGIALLAELRSAGWTSCLALSATDDVSAVRAALAAGIRGYVVTGTRSVPIPRPGQGMAPYRVGLPRPRLPLYPPRGTRPPVHAQGRPGMQLPPDPRTRPVTGATSGGMPPGPGTATRPTTGSSPMQAPSRALSEREIEVLRLVAEGRSNKAIGETMGLSALTVKSHLARIARKLGTGDRAGMVAVAMRNGIIP